MKFSFIATTLNEEQTIDLLLESVLEQTKLPDEVLLTDGGSTDRTISKIKSYNSKYHEKGIKLFVLEKNGNRSIGRNTAINAASGDIILCSDAGCILDKNWVKEISKPFDNKKIDVVAGYYRGKAENVFQKSLIPYVLVMEDKVNPDSFLPASRSMAFRKSVWEKIGGFNEKLSHNEDYAFAKALERANMTISFQKTAIVNWLPRTTLKQVYRMFYRFAFGDVEAHIYRPKVLFLFFRYSVAILLLLFTLYFHSISLILTACFLILLYLLWAIKKNFRYVNDVRAFFFLPLLQLIADIAVIHGSLLGFIQSNSKNK